MYFGPYPTVVDDKGRITVPRKFRDIMEREDHVTWHVTMGFNGNLCLYNRVEWGKLLEKTDSFPSMDPDIHDFLRVMLGLAMDARVDNQGRMPIPSHLRGLTGLDREVVLVGMGSRLELWSKPAWDAFCADMVPKFRTMASELFPRVEQPGVSRDKGVLP